MINGLCMNHRSVFIISSCQRTSWAWSWENHRSILYNVGCACARNTLTCVKPKNVLLLWHSLLNVPYLLRFYLIYCSQMIPYFFNLFNSCRLSSRCSTNQILQIRALSGADAVNALRPFYFAVHPDFFGQHPRERVRNDVNELMFLSAELWCLCWILDLNSVHDSSSPVLVFWFSGSEWKLSQKIKWLFRKSSKARL